MHTISARTFAVVCAAALVGCSTSNSDDDVPTLVGTPISVTTVERQVIREFERSIGASEAVSEPTIAAEVSGRVSQILVDIGDRIEAGTVLAKLDDATYRSELAAVDADIAALAARAAQLQADLDRKRAVGDGMYVSAAELEAAEAEVETLRQEIVAAENRQAESRRQLDRTEITAPFSGVIDARHIAEGGFVSAGNPAFRIIPDAASRVRLPYPEIAGERFTLGMPVELRRLGRDDGRATSGSITRIRPSVAGSMSVIVFVEFDLPADWQIGTMVEGRVLVRERPDALVVPTEAIVDRPGRKAVFVLPGTDNHGTVVERAVTLGQRRADVTEIVSGLDAGDRVVVDGAAFLADGAPVRVADGG